MDSKQLQVVEQRVRDALSESAGPMNESELALAVRAFLDFDAETYMEAKGKDHDRRVVLWIHALSHFTKELWVFRHYMHLKALYQEAVKRSDAVGDYGCMDRLLKDYLTYARWFDQPRDYGYGESVPDYETLYAKREGDTRTLERITKNRASLKYTYEQELILIRLRGFEEESQAWDWNNLQRVGWQKKE